MFQQPRKSTPPLSRFFDILAYQVFAFLFVITVLMPVRLLASEPCFLLANSYYEQIFCEVKAKGAGASLPSFYDFQKNNQITQALLLKRLTRRLGIAMKMPIPGTAITAANAKAVLKKLPPTVSDRELSNCQLKETLIGCSGKSYKLLGNLSNKHLPVGALAKDNQLILPAYQGSSDTELRQYLVSVYLIYLEKMVGIGLAGSTMTYRKFNFLYFDLTEKGVDFVARSKVVFEYLKKDKQVISVNERIAPVGNLSLQHCNKLSGNLIVCENQRKNYLYKGV